MRPGQCATALSVDDLSPNDQAEVGKFAVYLRQVSQAKAAGLTMDEAQYAMLPDAYPDDVSETGKTAGVRK